MEFKPDLNQWTYKSRNTTKTFSRNEQQQGSTARSGTLLNHSWQHFGKNYLDAGTFLPLLMILVGVFGAHGLSLELIAYVVFDVSLTSKRAGRWAHTPHSSSEETVPYWWIICPSFSLCISKSPYRDLDSFHCLSLLMNGRRPLQWTPVAELRSNQHPSCANTELTSELFKSLTWKGKYPN